jgi:hypothetical protein
VGHLIKFSKQVCQLKKRNEVYQKKKSHTLYSWTTGRPETRQLPAVLTLFFASYLCSFNPLLPSLISHFHPLMRNLFFSKFLNAAHFSSQDNEVKGKQEQPLQLTPTPALHFFPVQRKKRRSSKKAKHGNSPQVLPTALIPAAQYLPPFLFSLSRRDSAAHTTPPGRTLAPSAGRGLVSCSAGKCMNAFSES